MNITIDDVARVANVSKATVSAVLNNKGSVAPATRDKVLEVIKRLNYRPSEVARSLSIRKTRCIGLVIKEIDNPYFARVMKGVFDCCCENGYTVLLGSSELSPTQEMQSIETLVSQRVDGLIVSPLQDQEMDFLHLAELLRKKIPLVTLGAISHYSTNVVDIDNVQAARMAVSYLIQLGHRDIAYFAGPSYSAHSRDRLTGYQQAFIEHHLPIPKDRVQPAGSSIGSSFQAAMDFFSEAKPFPSAVFCYNDLVAIGLINALQQLGIGVPDQVSVLGFDDIDISAFLSIPLTTVRVPAYEIGRQAGALLIRQMQQPEQFLNEKLILGVELIERKSCARK